MSKFTKGLGIVVLALVISVGTADAAGRGGHGRGGWHGGGGAHFGGAHFGARHYGGGYRGRYYGGGYRGRYYGGGYRGRYYGGGYYGDDWGWGGFAAGAILGGLLAAPYYYAGPGHYYDEPAPADAVRYCMQRFKSYDPRSGTYLGYDGYRHPCP
jgi:BA14K-like protein